MIRFQKSTLLVAAVLSVSLTACASKQKPAEQSVAPAETTTTVAPQTPTCGGWAVVLEAPMVPAGKFNASKLQSSLVQGLAGAGCTALMSAPTDGTPVLAISTKASAIGEAGSIMLMATESSTGVIKWRFQEKVAAGQDGSAVMQTLGNKLASTLAG